MLKSLILGVLFSACLVLCDDKKDRGEGVKYNIDDGIEMLDAETFHSTIYNSPVAWFVKFYSGWCGHCKTFAPTYKALAKDMAEWQGVVRLGAVDCGGKSADGEDNGKKICYTKPFFISGMPDFRFFPANTTDQEYKGERRKYEGRKVYGSDGTIEEDSDSMEKVRESLIDFIQDTYAKNKNVKFSLGTLKKKKLSSLLEGEPDGDHHVFIIEPKSSYMGRQVILDMTSFSGVRVHRVARTNKKVLVLLKETFGFEFVTSPTVLATRDFVTHFSFTVPEDEDPRDFITTKLLLLPDVSRARKLKIIERRNDTRLSHENYVMPDVDRSKVYMHDLEVAIHYTLRKEVSSIQYIRGRHLQALKDLLDSLIRYFPGRPCVMKFLERVNKSVKDILITKTLVWGIWQEILESADEVGGAFLTKNETYFGCSGSNPDFRGFPCSLWQLYHVMLNQAYKYDIDGDWGVHILIGMKEYITKYFTCYECRGHWAAATKNIEDVLDSKDAILYLWSKHNSVNERLSGGKTDDPMFPKGRWPSLEMCPSCRDEYDQFDDEKVFDFLVDFYSPSNLLEDYVEEIKSVQEVVDSPRVEDAESPPVEEVDSPTGEDADSPLIKEVESLPVQDAESPLVKEAESPPFKDGELPPVEEAEAPSVEDAKSRTAVEKAESPPDEETESPTPARPDDEL